MFSPSAYHIVLNLHMLQKQCAFLLKKKILAAEPRYFILKLMSFCSIHVFTDVTGDVKEKKEL